MDLQSSGEMHGPGTSMWWALCLKLIGWVVRIKDGSRTASRRGRPPPLRGCGTRRRRGVHVDGVVVRISACRGAHVSSVAYVNLPDSRTAKVPCRRGWRRGAGGRKRWRTGAAISSTGAGRGGVEALAQGAGRPCARRAGAPGGPSAPEGGAHGRPPPLSS